MIYEKKGVWEGDYTINSAEDLLALSGYSTVIGNLEIKNTSLTNLEGLNNLTSVDQDFEIVDNDSLTSLVLNSLHFVGNNFYIAENINLCTSLAEELRDQVLSGGGIGGEIVIRDNKICP